MLPLLNSLQTAKTTFLSPPACFQGGTLHWVCRSWNCESCLYVQCLTQWTTRSFSPPSVSHRPFPFSLHRVIWFCSVITWLPQICRWHSTLFPDLKTRRQHKSLCIWQTSLSGSSTIKAKLLFLPGKASPIHDHELCCVPNSDYKEPWVLLWTTSCSLLPTSQRQPIPAGTSSTTSEDIFPPQRNMCVPHSGSNVSCGPGSCHFGHR